MQHTLYLLCNSTHDGLQTKTKAFIPFCLQLSGALWTFAPQNPHSTTEHLSFVAQISNYFEQINGLFDDTINDFYHHIVAFTTSNESFTYSQMLCKSNHKQFFEAMEIELDDHESLKHWKIMLCKDLPIGLKTIMAIWLFKQK